MISILKPLKTALTLLLLTAVTALQAQTAAFTAEREGSQAAAFSSSMSSTAPHALLNVWINEALPLSFYSEEEKKLQHQLNIETNDAVLVYAPEGRTLEFTEVDHEEINPFTWKWVDFELQKPDGTLTKINLRRPNWWIKETGAGEVGKKVYLSIPELGAEGWAKVKAVRFNLLDTRFWDENRQGDYVSRPITGKFEHISDEVLRLYFGENTEALGVTASHQIWSVDRNTWVEAGDLEVGETVKTQYGNVSLTSKERLSGKHRVYNLEVYRDHNFLVGVDKILVHNSCFSFKSLQGKSINWIKRQKPKDWKTVQKDNGKGWKWLDADGNERLIYQRPSGQNATNSQWSRMENGYFRRRNAGGDYLDIDGNVVPKTDPDFQWKTHIPYEGIH